MNDSQFLVYKNWNSSHTSQCLHSTRPNDISLLGIANVWTVGTMRLKLNSSLLTTLNFNFLIKIELSIIYLVETKLRLFLNQTFISSLFFIIFAFFNLLHLLANIAYFHTIQMIVIMEIDVPVMEQDFVRIEERLIFSLNGAHVNWISILSDRVILIL